MAQAGLTALDTWMSKKWRERERQWRKDERQWRVEDMIVREEERNFNAAVTSFRHRRCRWREEDVLQRRVDNSHYLWSRFAELNRRDVDEKAEHLRLLSWITGLITSFTMTVPVEFNYETATVSTDGRVYLYNHSKARLTVYAVFNAIVPTLMTTATMICVFLLGCILKMGKWFVSEEGEEEFMAQCRIYAASNEQQAPPAPRRTFERFWEYRCEDDWNRAFRLFSWGITSFLVLLCTMSFIKFEFKTLIAILYTSTMGIFFIIWLGIKFTYGTYLRQEAEDGPALTVSHRQRELSWSEDPFKWHIKPLKGTSEASSSSLLNCELEVSTPSVPWVQSFEESSRSSSLDILPVENTTLHQPL